MKPCGLTPEHLARIAELAAARHTDRQIAAALGCHVSSVFAARKRTGIRAGYDPRANTGNRQKGLRAGHRTMRRQRDALAARYGLPAGLTQRQVQILVALVSGPLTREQLAAAVGACGRQGREFRTGSYAHGRRATLLSDLEERGLVVARVRVPEFGRGRLPNLYTLSPLALALMAKGGAA